MFTFTDRRPKGANGGPRQSLLVSYPMMAKYSGISSVRNMKYERLVLKMQPEYQSNEEQQKFVKDVKDSLSGKSYLFQILTGLNQALEKVEKIVSVIFTVIIIIAMFLCFFSLSSSMSANLYDQQKEIGIMRALGFSKSRIVMLYTYESFILVMASSLLGVFVGTVTAFTMVLQFTTFVGMPTIFYFPWLQIAGIFLAGILCAAMSSIGPTKAIVS